MQATDPTCTASPRTETPQLQALVPLVARLQSWSQVGGADGARAGASMTYAPLTRGAQSSPAASRAPSAAAWIGFEDVEIAERSGEVAGEREVAPICCHTYAVTYAVTLMLSLMPTTCNCGAIVRSGTRQRALLSMWLCCQCGMRMNGLISTRSVCSRIFCISSSLTAADP